MLNGDQKFYMSKNLAIAMQQLLSTFTDKEKIDYLSDIFYFLDDEHLIALSDDLGVNQEYLVDNEPD